jgi:hypothetical protein
MQTVALPNGQETQRLLDDARDTILRQHAAIEALADDIELKRTIASRAGYMAGWNGCMRGDHEERARVAYGVKS